MFDLNFDLSRILVTIPVILLALSVHEFSHGFIASRLGDPTPRLQGRLTLNPLAHLDPIGTIMMIVASFGWAKPVQVNPNNFKGNRSRGMMLVALAGPSANILLAFVGAFIYNLLELHAASFLVAYPLLERMLVSLIILDVYLAVFNLIPLPPLDGSNILLGLVPAKYYYRIAGLGAYSTIILFALLMTGMVGRILAPAAQVLIDFLVSITYLLAKVL